MQSVAGLAADGRQIVARARAEAARYERFHFCTNIVDNDMHHCK